jgi:hypothetical protein
VRRDGVAEDRHHERFGTRRVGLEEVGDPLLAAGLGHGGDFTRSQYDSKFRYTSLFLYRIMD